MIFYLQQYKNILIQRIGIFFIRKHFHYYFITSFSPSYLFLSQGSHTLQLIKSNNKTEKTNNNNKYRVS